MSRPVETDYPAFYKKYIEAIEGKNIETVIDLYSKDINDFFQNLPNEKADYAYAPNKWTVKDLLQHVIDAERIFVYRATRFSRKDDTMLPGFEENEYAKNAVASNRNFDDLKNEFIFLRKSTDAFLLSLSKEQLSCKGNANGKLITVNAIAFIIFGHILHHKNILVERYL